MWRMIAIAAVWALGAHGALQAEAIRFRDYKLLDEGMSKAEVLRRVGPPTHREVVSTDAFYQSIWYYTPERPSSSKWTTVLYFDANGKLKRLERFPPYGRGD